MVGKAAASVKSGAKGALNLATAFRGAFPAATFRACQPPKGILPAARALACPPHARPVPPVITQCGPPGAPRARGSRARAPASELARSKPNQTVDRAAPNPPPPHSPPPPLPLPSPDFLLQGDMVAMLVAFVVGAAFTTLVKAFVTDLVTPLIAAIFGGERTDS